MSEPTHTRPPLFPRRLLKPLAIAFGAGLLLFLALWFNQRPDNDFYKPGPDGQAARQGDPLPAPLPADVATGDDNASGLRLPGAEAARPGAAVDQPRLLEPPPAPPAPMPAPAPPVGGGGATDPVPLNRPPPEYPREALRSRAGGTVRVRATVAANGRVERLELVQGSGNRHLDRAASEAVRRWTFRPATRNGQPVSADVIVPVSFEPPR